MEAADLKKAAGTAIRTVRNAGAAIGRSPALALLTAVAAGFVAGLVMRRFERPKPRE
jgi:hypothetical protein